MKREWADGLILRKMDLLKNGLFNNNNKGNAVTARNVDF